MKLTCDEATTICDKNQYKEASFREIIKLNVHIFLCKKCGIYSKQNSILTKCYEKHLLKESVEKRLYDDEKVIMEKELKSKI